MAANKPDITIVIPVWDSYMVWLPRALGSLASSRKVIKEVIIVNNRSSTPVDFGPDLGLDIRVIDLNKRLTVGAARNFALRSVSTDWVIFLDADDEMLPGGIERMREAVEGGVVCVSRRQVIDQQTGEHYPAPLTSASAMSQDGKFKVLGFVRPLFAPIGNLLQTAAVRQAGGFDDSEVGEDWVLAAHLPLRGPIKFQAEAARIYWRRADSVSARAAKWSDVAAVRVRLLQSILRRQAPPWLRAALPMIAVLQIVDILILAPKRQRRKRRFRPR